MVIAQISIAPVGKGIDLAEFVKEAIKIFKKYEIPFQVNDMATVLETEDLETLFLIVKEAHNAVLEKGANRIITELKIDDRKDKSVKLGDKSSSVQI